MLKREDSVSCSMFEIDRYASMNAYVCLFTDKHTRVCACIFKLDKIFSMPQTLST